MKLIVAIAATIALATAAQALPVKTPAGPYSPIVKAGTCTTRCMPTFGGGQNCTTSCF